MDEEQIIQKLQSRDKDEILDIPTLLLNEKNIDLNALIAIATKAKVESEILALIDIANFMERRTDFETVLGAHYDDKFDERAIEDAIFRYDEFRRVIKRSFLEPIEQRWNIKISFTYDDFYKVYRDYHLLPYHGERLKIYFGDIIEI
jgi:hypothetical protein